MAALVLSGFIVEVDLESKNLRYTMKEVDGASPWKIAIPNQNPTTGHQINGLMPIVVQIKVEMIFCIFKSYFFFICIIYY